MGTKSKTEDIAGCLKIIHAAERKGESDISDHCLKLGELYANKGKTADAKVYLNRAISCGNLHKNYNDVAFACRQMANIALDENECADATYFIDEYVKVGEKMSRLDIVQLGYHELCRIYLRWANSLPDDEEALNRCALLYKAKMYGLQSLKVLENHASEFDHNKDVRINFGTVQRRKAGINQIMLQVYAALGQFDKAKEKADSFRTLKKDPHDDIYYCCMDVSLDIEFEPEERLQLALKIVEAAKGYSKIQIWDSILQLSKEYILTAQYKEALIELYKQRMALPGEDEDIDKLIVFAYVTLKREERLGKLQTSERYIRFKINEKIGDAAYNTGLFHVQYKFFQRMLTVSKELGLKEQKSALTSVAFALDDLNKFKESEQYFKQLLDVEAALELPSCKLVETKVCIYKSVFKSGAISVHDKLTAFENVYKLTLSNATRCKLLKDMIGFLKCFDSDVEVEICLDKYTADLEKYSKLDELEEDDSSASSESADLQQIDEFDGCDEESLLRNALIFAQKLTESQEKNDYIKNLRNNVNKIVNPKGETQLHLAARGEGKVPLIQLIKLGWNVNKRDYGGWTPLTEAVNANLLENVRTLLENGADVNVRSTEGIECTNIHSGLTPLEDACVCGYVSIAKLLLYRNARVTGKAVSFLKQYMRKPSEELSSDDIEELDQLLAILVEKLRLKGEKEPDAELPLSRSPSPSIIRSVPLKSRGFANRSEGNANLDIYERTMEMVGHGRRHNRTSADITLDDDELEKEHLNIPVGSVSPPAISPLRLMYSQPHSPLLLNRSGSNSQSKKVADIFKPKSRKRPHTVGGKSVPTPDAKRHLSRPLSMTTNSVRIHSPGAVLTPRQNNTSVRLLFEDAPSEHFATTSRSQPSASRRTRQECTNPQAANTRNLVSSHKVYKITVSFEDDKQRKILPDFNVTISGTKTVAQLRTNCNRKVTDKFDSLALKYQSVPLSDHDSISKSFGCCQTPCVSCELYGWRVPQLSLLFNRFYPAANQKIYRKVLNSDIGELNFCGLYLLSKDDILNVFDFVDKYSTLPVQFMNFHGIAVNADMLKRIAELFSNTVTELDISSCSLSDIMIRAMMHDGHTKERTFPELSKLNLAANFFTSKHMDTLIRRCTDLSVLDLSLIPFQDDIYARCETLGRTIAGLPYLAELKMRSCGAIEPIMQGLSEAAVDLKSLARLDVSCTEVKNILRVLKRCPNLKSINVSDCEQLAVDELLLEYVVSSKIEEIDLSGCSIKLGKEKLTRIRKSLNMRIEECIFQNEFSNRATSPDKRDDLPGEPLAHLNDSNDVDFDSELENLAYMLS